MPNHIPYHRWQIILIDLITELPQSHGYDLSPWIACPNAPTSSPSCLTSPHSESLDCFKTAFGPTWTLGGGDQ